MDEIKLGKFIAKMRNEKHLTQDELAEKLGYDNSKKISRWECGNSVPDFIDLIRLSQILDVTLYELSICKKIKDKTILDATKDRLKTLKDYQRMTNHKKALILIAILFGLLFGLTTIYTIDNYNTVEIYRLESLDKEYYIEGNYIKTKNKQIFNVTNLGYLDNNNNNLNMDVRDVEYRVLLDNEALLNITYKSIRLNKKTNNIKLFNAINDTSFSETIHNKFKLPNKILTFQIIYANEKNIKKTLEFKFELKKIFANNFNGI